MNRSLVFDHDIHDMACHEEGHAHGCPCGAGGDAIRLSMLRCSECGDFLDETGSCVMHGLLDPEMADPNREGDPAFNGAFDKW